MSEILKAGIMECLSGLVGITEKDCDCFPMMNADQVQEITTSETGIFVDEHEGIKTSMFLREAGCGENDVWTRLLNAKYQAIRETVLRISLMLNNKFTSSVNRGFTLGKQGYGSLTTSEAAGEKIIPLQMNNVEGGYIKITHVGFVGKLVNNTISTQIEISLRRIKNNISTIVDNFYIVVDKDKDTELYYLGDDSVQFAVDGARYELYYVYDPTKVIMYSSDISCSNCNRNNAMLNKFFKVFPSGMSYGLIFQLHLTCNDQWLACALAKSNDTVKHLIAKAIQEKTLQNFLITEQQATSEGLTAFVVMDIDGYNRNITGYGLAWAGTLTEIANYNLYDIYMKCFMCRPNQIGRTQGMIL